MDIPKSPVFSDGPQYSRISGSATMPSKWYAEGHTDDEDAEEGEWKRRRRQEIEKEEREKEEREKENERELDGAGVDSPESGSPPKAGAKSIKFSPVKTEGGEGALSRTTADNDGDSSVPPPSGQMGSPSGSPRGAQYLPEASVQDSPNRDVMATGTNRSSPSSTPQNWRQSKYASDCWWLISLLTRLPVLLTVTLCFAFSLGIYIAIIAWIEPGVAKSIYQAVTLRPSTFSLPLLNARISLDVYFYNTTPVYNRLGHLDAIHTKEIGPYTYTVKSTKTDVTWNKNQTVSYRVMDTFHFKPNTSVRDENDVIYTIDINKLLRLRESENSSDIRYLNGTALSNEVVEPQTVGDILWGTSSHSRDEGPTKVMKKLDLLKLYKFKTPGKKIKVNPTPMKMMNQSVSPLYNVYTGKSNIGRLNEMYTYNYSRVMSMWPFCHNYYPMSGTADGNFFSPLLKKHNNLAMFYSQIERNVLLQYKRTLKFKGKKAYRYIIPYGVTDANVPRFNSNLQATENNLTVGESMGDFRLLNGDHIVGVNTRLPTKVYLRYPNEESPFLVSLPSQEPEAIGKDPVCKPYVDIHPVSGITLRKRLCHQMSLPIVYPGKGSERDVKFILPIMWVNWYYESVTGDLDQMMSSYWFLQQVSYVHIVAKSCLFFFGVFLVVLMAFAIVYKRFVKKGATDYYSLEPRD